MFEDHLEGYVLGKTQEAATRMPPSLEELYESLRHRDLMDRAIEHASTWCRWWGDGRDGLYWPHGIYGATDCWGLTFWEDGLLDLGVSIDNRSFSKIVA